MRSSKMAPSVRLASMVLSGSEVLRMPKPAEPKHDAWARRIAELIGDTTNPVLVGHSFGASVLLKYLAEASRRPSFTGLFLVATPSGGRSSENLPCRRILPFVSRLLARSFCTTVKTIPRCPSSIWSDTPATER